ncbi:MAG: tetratricopeptide repeat protein [Bacteroidales bacterium]|nr:tetratricopeptide repeat protein [Bacteroidales bacterium]MBN2757269.1 tetratricopeptide repeat protein [Bacteroidales bacterium]
MKKLLIILIFHGLMFLFSVKVYSQQSIDCLIKVVDTCKIERKPIVYSQLADEYYYSGNFENSLIYYLKSAEESLKNIDSSYTILIESYGNVGFLYNEMAIYDKAIEYNKKALKYAQLYKNQIGIANAYNGLGNSYIKLADFEKAAFYFENALEIDIKIGNKSVLSLDYNSLGKLYQQWQKYNIALEYFQKALDIDEKENRRDKMAIRFNSIGIVYKDIEMYDSAIFFLNKALYLDQELSNEKEIAIRMSNLGSVYSQINEFDKAEKLFKQAISIFKNLEINYSLSISYNELAELYLRKNEYKLAKRYSQESLALSNNLHINNITKENYKRLSTISYITSNYKSAFHYYQLYSDIKDSIFNEKSMNAINILEVKHQTQKKELEIELLSNINEINILELEKNKTKRRFLNIYLIMALLLVIVILIILLIIKKSNIKLEKKNLELSLLNATKDKFFSIISHDLKNPLSAFWNIANSLDQNIFDLSKEEIKYYTEQLKQSSGTVYEMLENLLLWAKSQLGGIKPQFENLNLKILVDNIIKSTKPFVNTKNIELINDINADIVWFTDKNIINTILRNFITNGIKFSDKDGKVIISAERMNGFMQIKVKDTGIGISELDINKLFKIDFDTKKIGFSEEKGSGLGLILCEDLVKIINGKITVESKVNKGSAFIINLS